MRQHFFCVPAIFLTLAPAFPAGAAEPVSAPFTVPAAAAGAGMTAIPAGKAGLDYLLIMDPAHPLNRLYYSAYFAGGIAAGDVNGDALPDLVISSGTGPNRLYLNSGDFTFRPSSANGGLAGGDTWGSGVTMADADGDGDLDVYLCTYDSPNQLWLNDGKGSFDSAPADSGAAVKDGSQMAAFADYDRDGDLDLYVLTNRLYREGGRPQTPPYRMGPGNVPEMLPEFAPYYKLEKQGRADWTANEYGRRDHLLRNDSAPGGPLRYTDVTEEAGVADIGHGLSVTWWDFDGDGWLDLYVANDFDDPDHLYKNLGPVRGKVRFQDVTRAALPHTAWFAMGADAGDLTNDGLPDFFVVDMAATTHFKDKLTMGDMSAKYELMEFGEPRQIMRNALYVNTGTWRFTEAAYMAGVARSDWSWTAKMLDLDLDGRLDLYVTNGMNRNYRDSDRLQPPSALVGKTEWDLYKDLDPLPEVNRAWRNAGDLKFEDVAKPWGLADEGISYGAAHADFDGDGDPDLAVINLDRPVSLYRNDFAGHRVVFRLDTPRRTQGIGTTLTLRAGGLLQTRTLSPATGFTSCNEPLVFFGLGTAEKIDELTVRWPSGHTETFRGLAADRRYTLTQPVAPVEPPGVAPWTGPDAEAIMEDITLTFPAPASQGMDALFTETAAFPASSELELAYDEFRHEQLLPNKLTHEGPGIACADVDGDGDEDVFLARSRSRERRVWFNDGKGGFQPGPPAAFAGQTSSEDAGVLFFDADADGDADLYVASGSTEELPGAAGYQDRLYLNDGKGAFTHAHDALPKLTDSSSAVAAADFDRDGDLDLFVGTRVLPRQYPLPATSRLLRNDGGKFTDTAAPVLKDTGLVTAAVWTDPDSDGWLDLAVAHEWGPVKLFRNVKGKLNDATEAAGLSQWPGWWLGLIAADLDNDGDMDLAAGNFGLNTKYKATEQKPELIFHGDVDGSGTPQIVEAKYEGDILVPRRGYSCSSTAMPSLKGKLKSYRTFAGSTLSEVYSDDRLAKARKFSATTLESGVFLNDGKGRYSFRALPRAAQIAPVHGLAALDADADGHLDLVLAQNFWHPQRETGRMAGGTGLVLKGTGDGTFAPLTIAQSGVLIPGDARGLITADFNGDTQPDFAVAENNGPVRAFIGKSAAPRTTVRLKGPKGNPHAIGARITLSAEGLPPQAAEVTAGGSWLSQSSSTANFTVPPGTKEVNLTIRWPGGRVTKHKEKPGALEIVQPSGK